MKKYIAILMMVLFVTSLAACSGKGEEKPDEESSGTVFVIDDRGQDKAEVVEAQKNPLSGRNVFFAGYADATLTKTTTVALENLPDNEDFLMKYTVINTADDSVVFETNMIRAGQCVVWVPGEELEPGTYQFQILQSPYYQSEEDEFIPLTTGTTDVCYEITE